MFQENLIEFVDLKEVSCLYSLNLSHNKLTSVHGLTGCTNLRWLDVSHNRLTKLGELRMPVGWVSCGCPSVKWLAMFHNRLTKLDLEKMCVCVLGGGGGDTGKGEDSQASIHKSHFEGKGSQRRIEPGSIHFVCHPGTLQVTDAEQRHPFCLLAQLA